MDQRPTHDLREGKRTTRLAFTLLDEAPSRDANALRRLVGGSDLTVADTAGLHAIFAVALRYAKSKR